MKVVFLDIDGVLNGYNKISLKLYEILKPIFDIDIFGISILRVLYLKIILMVTNAKIVLSSSRRNSWYLPYEMNGSRIKKMKRLFDRLNIEVIGITPNINHKRELEIIKYLEANSNITNYVILDDENFGIPNTFLVNNFVLTSKDGEIRGRAEENTGLKLKHIFSSIKILNKKHL